MKKSGQIFKYLTAFTYLAFSSSGLRIIASLNDSGIARTIQHKQLTALYEPLYTSDSAKGVAQYQTPDKVC